MSEELPEAVFVVIRSTGEYSDRAEDPVAAVLTEDDAKAFVAEAERQYATALMLHPFPEAPKVAWGNDAAYGSYREARKRRADLARPLCVLDPEAIDEHAYSAHDEKPCYFYHAVRLLAQGIEAAGADETA